MSPQALSLWEGCLQSSMVIHEKAYAKLNLSLDIVEKMADGYHSMKMVMQSVELCDDVTIECTEGTGIAVSTNLVYIPNDDRNIAAKAARLFMQHTGINPGQISITINKRIPVCAGMGGGSTDGAAVLRGLNAMFSAGLSRKELEHIARKVGSDVPFCVAGGTQLALGRGDELTPLPQLPRCSVAICKPSFAISTPELFSNIRCEKIRSRPDTEGILEALAEGSVTGVARRMYNVFEDVVVRGKGDIDSIKTRMLDSGAYGTIMTGAGSAVFGIFPDDETVQNACNDLQTTYKEVFLTHTNEIMV